MSSAHRLIVNGHRERGVCTLAGRSSRSRVHSHDKGAFGQFQFDLLPHDHRIHKSRRDAESFSSPAPTRFHQHYPLPVNVAD